MTNATTLPTPPTNFPIRNAFVVKAHLSVGAELSFNRHTEADALTEAGALMLRGALYVQVLEMMHVCSECNGHGSKRMKNDRYRKCRACGGSPFRFQFVAEAGKQPVGGFFLG